MIERNIQPLDAAANAGEPSPPTGPFVVVRRTIIVNNPQGLHLRPAAAFAKRARDFKANVTVYRDDRSVNGKSQLDLVLLAAESGTQLTIEASGADAETAIDELAALLGKIWTDEIE